MYKTHICNLWYVEQLVRIQFSIVICVQSSEPFVQLLDVTLTEVGCLDQVLLLLRAQLPLRVAARQMRWRQQQKDYARGVQLPRTVSLAAGQAWERGGRLVNS